MYLDHDVVLQLILSRHHILLLPHPSYLAAQHTKVRFSFNSGSVESDLTPSIVRFCRDRATGTRQEFHFGQGANGQITINGEIPRFSDGAAGHPDIKAVSADSSTPVVVRPRTFVFVVVDTT